MRRLSVAVGLSAVALAATVPAMAQAPQRVAYTVAPFAPSGQVTINGTGVRLRAEPFATRETQVLSSGSTGLPLTVVGIACVTDWNWYQVILRNGQKAFIRSDLTSAPSRCSGAPAMQVASAAPAPYASPTTSTKPLPPAPLPAPYNPAQPPVLAAPPPAYSAPAPLPPVRPQPQPQAQQQGGGPISLFPSSPAPTANTDGLQSH